MDGYSAEEVSIAALLAGGLASLWLTLYAPLAMRVLRWLHRRMRARVPPRPNSAASFDRAIEWLFFPFDAFTRVGPSVIALLFAGYLLLFCIPVVLIVITFVYLLKGIG